MSAPAKPLPPKPKSSAKPAAYVKVVRSLYKYTAQYDDDLSFEEGDVLYITDMSSTDGWWKAKCGTNVGLIPSNYVEDNMESIDNPIHEACKRGNLTFLTECIDNKVSVNSLDKAGCVGLHWACRGGHIECVNLLLAQASIIIDVQNKLGDTPLHSAAWKGHSQIVQALIDKGSDISLINNDGKTPYQLASDPQSAALLKSRYNALHQRKSSTHYDNDEYVNDDDNEDSD